MDVRDYLIRNVKPNEFTDLKKQEADLVAIAKKATNEAWEQKVGRMKVYFRYNPSREMIGIYIGGNEKQRLAIGKRELTEEENVVVNHLYELLVNNLDTLRLPKEQWVDSL